MPTLKQGLLVVALFAWVLIVSLPILQYDMMYAEQPTLYLANQMIQSVSDLWHAYWQPKLLDIAIPFFRPSGHFLLYQLLTPVFGWHNTRALVMVNLFFLALTGCVMVRLYGLLFPGRQVGGYIAFAIYVMQPALMLSRLTVMHFEFASILFVVLSLYYFVLYCQKNKLHTRLHPASATVSLRHNGWLVLALSCFSVAVTFKESAIMLGPVLASYLLIGQCRQPWVLLRQKALRQLLLLLTVLTFSLACYLTLPWPGFANPDRVIILGIERLGSIKYFMSLLFSLPQPHQPHSALSLSTLVLRHIVVPSIAHVIMWFSLLCSVLATVLLVRRSEAALPSVCFLAIACVLFLVLPVLWAMGLPWHLCLSSLFLGLLSGFSVDYVLVKKQRWARPLIAASFVLIGLAAWQVNQDNITYLKSTPEGFAYRVNRNAVFHPPAIAAQLNAQSVVVVEDSLGLGDYALGNTGYPYYLAEHFDYDAFQARQHYRYVQYQPLYNGTLFRWAYLLPRLQEEYFPSSLRDLRDTPDEAIYHWLQHINNIFSFGYDQEANWFDRTATFKKNLLAEQARRHLAVNRYRQWPHTLLAGPLRYTRKTAIPDPVWCQMVCDQDSHCQGFSALQWVKAGKTTSGCEFYRSIALSAAKPCTVCTGYLKMH